GDDDADDEGDDLSEDDADKEESSDSEEEEEEHLAPTVPTPALHSSISTSEDSDETEPFEEGETAATPPPFGYRVAARIFIRPHIPITPKADMPLQKRTRFTTPTGGYEKMAPKRARTTRANPDLTRTTTTTEPMTQEAINNLIAQHVTEALAKYETQRNSVVNGDTSHTTGKGPKTMRPTRECSYKDYLNYGPLKFNGTEGVIGLTRWFERIESVSSISNCTAENQMMTVKYCPRGEVKKLEVKLWNIKKPYGGTKPLCPKCNFHHDGPCRPKSTNCKRTGHIARDCRSRAANTNNNNNNNNYNNQRATAAYQGVSTCFECRAQGHFKNNCPKLGNRNQGNRNQGNQNQARNGNAVARAYGVGTAGGNPDANAMMGMGWLKTYHAVIVRDEKIVRVPFGNETLIIQCNGSNNGAHLNIISCTKTRKYLLKGYLVFFANITTKTIKDKSEEKRLENVPIVRDFSEVFLEDLPGLPPTRHVEFQIDLIPGAALVTRAPYRLAPSEMKELSDQLQELSDKGF
nr:reverse transcriptase domain-containing protein [Tanacetum cinerariifolium]